MKIIVKKIIVEIRFLPILKFSELATDYFQDIMENYTQLNEAKNFLELRHQLQSKKIFCERVRAGLALENISEIQSFASEVDVLIGLLSHCKVKKTSRLGLRSFFLTPLTDITYDDAIQKFAKAHLNIPNMVFQPPNLEDYAVTVVGSDGDFKFTISSGIVDKDEIISKHSEYDYDDDPDVAFFVDIDNYILAQDFTPSTKIITDMFESSKTIVESYMEKNHELS